MENVSLVIGIISLAACVVTAMLAYMIYRYNRTGVSILPVVAAFVLMFVRRGMGFVRELAMYPDMNTFIVLAENVLQVVISLLFIWGFWMMLKNFQRFEVVEKYSKEKAASFKNCECHLKNKKRKR